MNDLPIHDRQAQDLGYFTFMDRDEKTVSIAKGVLDDTINGYIVLTTKKLFFFFWSNINRDRKFIATYPFIESAELESGILNSILTVKSKKETFIIKKIKKAGAIKIFENLNEIISKNAL